MSTTAPAQFALWHRYPGSRWRLVTRGSRDDCARAERELIASSTSPNAGDFAVLAAGAVPWRPVCDWRPRKPR